MKKQKTAYRKVDHLSPLLSNIMLNELDKELERRGHRFVRYADDLMIFCKSRKQRKAYTGKHYYRIIERETISQSKSRENSR